MGKTIKPGLHLEFELENGYAALGFIEGISTAVSSDYYIESIIDYAHAAMAEDFNIHMQAVAAGAPWKFHHVYEPGYVGVPEMALWTHKLFGKGKTRQASFEWKQSRLPIIKPAERANNPMDPMSKVDPDIIEKLSTEDYVFRMRAPIMEFGLSTTVTPRPGTKALFIPTFKANPRRSGKKGAREWTTAHFRFEKWNQPDWNYRNPQEPSIKGTTVGQFTTQWVSFWSGGGAAAAWDMKVQQAVNGGIDEAAKEMGKVVSRRTRKRRETVGFASFSNNKAAEESGRNLALAFLKGKATSYKRAANYIAKRGYFGQDTGY